MVMPRERVRLCTPWWPTSPGTPPSTALFSSILGLGKFHPADSLSPIRPSSTLVERETASFYAPLPVLLFNFCARTTRRAAKAVVVWPSLLHNKEGLREGCRFCKAQKGRSLPDNNNSDDR